MAYPFGSLVFTPIVKELQERYGSRRSYAKREESRFSQDALGPDEEGFLAEGDSFYMASIGKNRLAVCAAPRRPQRLPEGIG